jgi:hypothetical protein
MCVPVAQRGLASGPKEKNPNRALFPFNERVRQEPVAASIELIEREPGLPGRRSPFFSSFLFFLYLFQLNKYC